MWSHRISYVLAVLAVALMGLTFVPSCETIDSEGGQGDALEQPTGFQGIVGGKPTEYKQFRGVIGLAAGMSMCTGTLIAPDVVLTAGHCVLLDDPEMSINYVEDPASLQILGGNNLMDEFDPTNKVYGVATRVIPHPTWQGSLNRNATDLSMIKLEEPIEGVEVYGLRQAPAVAVGTKGKIVGYGLSSSRKVDQMSAGVHRVGDTTVKSISNRVMELGNPAGTCQGDSGGPFFSLQDGKWVLTGVTSFGVSQNCYATGGAYDVNVLSNLSWIQETFKELTGYDLSEVQTATQAQSEGTEPMPADNATDEGISSDDQGTADPPQSTESDGTAANADNDAPGEVAGSKSSGSCSTRPVGTFLSLFALICHALLG